MRVLVANRGEIACRVLRTLRRLNVPSVAVFTPPDAHAPHVWLADSTWALSDASGYLDGAALIAIAKRARATAIHPGYGFLSQDPSFARDVVSAGLRFIGPSHVAMAKVGDKRAVRALAHTLGIPTVPGAESVASADDVREVAKRLGYPLLLKASAGGGGRGMRQVLGDDAAPSAVASARREAQTAFRDGRLLVERYIHPARHIEVQIMGDGQGIQILGDRECSLQRRYQKVLEEGPASALSASQREALYRASAALGEHVGYAGAGTMEFLLGPDGAAYFLEMNTRLQVEHPVTEMCTGLDLVAMQLDVAQGGRIEHGGVVRPMGHAVEVRLNAENPAEQFVPQTGQVVALQWPTGPNIRIDAGVDVGSSITDHYDPLLAKLIAWGPHRDAALATLRGALDELFLLGVRHNQSFLRTLLDDDAVVRGQTFTTTVEDRIWAEPVVPEPIRAALGSIMNATSAAMSQVYHQDVRTRPVIDDAGPWFLNDGFGREHAKAGRSSFKEAANARASRPQTPHARASTPSDAPP